MVTAANQPGVVEGPGGTALWDRLLSGAGDLVEVWNVYAEADWKREQNRREWEDETERLQREIEDASVSGFLEGQAAAAAEAAKNNRGLVIGVGLLLGLLGIGLFVRG